LVDLGYTEIAVAGLSLGGVLGLKLAYSTKIKAVIPMCTTMYIDNEQQLKLDFKSFTKEYKQLRGKYDQSIDEEVENLMDESKKLFYKVAELIKDVNSNIDMIYAPTFVVQARQDQMINTKSAPYIFEHVESVVKDIKWYEESGHVI